MRHTSPAAVKGTASEVERAFSKAFAALDRRISLFLCLPLARRDTFALQKEIDQIGRQRSPFSKPQFDGNRKTMKRVIFACVHNAGRSQMAAAFFNHYADPGRAQAISAGTEPGTQVHPEVQAVMLEAGIDLSGAKPQKLTEDLARDTQLLITMGCGDQCPYMPGLRREDWPLRDPKGLPTEEVRVIRDDIEERVKALLASEGLGRQHPAADLRS
jgi:protein-tyrosine-phosphatase